MIVVINVSLNLSNFNILLERGTQLIFTHVFIGSGGALSGTVSPDDVIVMSSGLP